MEFSVCIVWPSWVQKAKTDPHAKNVLDRYRNRPEFELYQLSNDPNEQTNLAGQQEHVEILSQLKNELETWMNEQGDDRKLEKPRK